MPHCPWSYSPIIKSLRSQRRQKTRKMWAHLKIMVFSWVWFFSLKLWLRKHNFKIKKLLFRFSKKISLKNFQMKTYKRNKPFHFQSLFAISIVDGVHWQYWYPELSVRLPPASRSNHSGFVILTGQNHPKEALESTSYGQQKRNRTCKMTYLVIITWALSQNEQVTKFTWAYICLYFT